jgi:hypothetical protein
LVCPMVIKRFQLVNLRLNILFPKRKYDPQTCPRPGALLLHSSCFFIFLIFWGSLLVPLGILCSSLDVFWAHLGWGFLDLRSLALFLVQWWHLILVNIISLARS